MGDIPEGLDLRRQGWNLAEHDEAGGACVKIVHAAGLDGLCQLHLLTITPQEERRMMLVGGANTPEARAQWLASGFGDAVSDETSLAEVDARARRLADLARWVPRRRTVSTLELDLIGREATYKGKSLNLHPREFSLLWRLAESPDEPVSREVLIRDVWRNDTAPESNSVAVHMSRLRSKLAAAGLDGLIEPGARRGYRLRRSVLDAVPPSLRQHVRPAMPQLATAG